jgi:hypothetical protein
VTIAYEADRGFDLISDRNQAAAKVSAGSDAELPKFLTLLMINMATDPHDKVYTSLGFREDFATEDILVDYALSIATVYLNTAKHLLKAISNLDWLESSITSRIDGLPTWVTDWSMERKSLPLPKTLEPGPVSQAEVTPVYQASGTVPQLLALFAPKEDSGKLNLKAIYIDRLATISQRSNIEHMSTEPWIQNLFKHLDTPYFAKTSDSDSDNGGESIFQVLLRTLLLDYY